MNCVAPHFATSNKISEHCGAIVKYGIIKSINNYSSFQIDRLYWQKHTPTP
ncbi:MAG: hypothetical protein F6K54_16015 [Okeania sp. SIO3B5]|uniref:hypothetical protein n=1 Tax=Okeania sp. SIO3B5 TaxID=2607811 RepID=UPI00140070E2|nr:hypothetical protein [Okeania sp. SIO3B5]NEO54453.1 hypothetical protein [Okeania sp. SIO3B5]